jgi:hypothetical protein
LKAMRLFVARLFLEIRLGFQAISRILAGPRFSVRLRSAPTLESWGAILRQGRLASRDSASPCR